MKTLKGTQTEKNLLTSFAGESQARNRYTFFASKAKKEGYEQIADVYTEIGIKSGFVIHEYVYSRHYYAGYPQIYACPVFEPQIDYSCYYSQNFKHDFNLKG